MSSGDFWAFFGVNPKGAVDGMNVAKKAVRSGSKDITSSLNSVKSLARTVFIGWGVAALGKSFIQSAMDMDSMRRSMAAATGSFEKGRREMNFLREHSQKMGLSFKNSAQDFKQLSAAAKGTALEGKGIRDVWKSLINATVALQLTTAETSGTVYAFKDMLSKGTVQAEELKRQLGNRLPGAFRLAADAMGLTTQELAKQMKLGQLMSDDFLPALAKALDKTYAGAALEAAKSMRAELTRLQSSWFDFKDVFMQVSGATEGVTSILKSLNKALKDMTKYILDNEKAIKSFFIDVGGYAQKFGVYIKQGFNNIVGLVQWFKSDTEKAKQVIPILAKAVAEVFVSAFRISMDAKMKIATGALGKKFILGAMSPLLAIHDMNRGQNSSGPSTYSVVEKAFGLDKVSVIEESSRIMKEAFEDLSTDLKYINDDLNKELEEKGLSGFVSIVTDKFAKNKEKTKKELADIEAIILKSKAALASAPSTKFSRSLMPEDEDPNNFEYELSKWEKIFNSLKGKFEKLSLASTDVAKNIESVFTSAFKGIEDALAQMVTKGKIDWRSLADSMLADMARIAARQAITGPLYAALGVGMKALTNWAGPGDTNIGTGNTAGTTFTGFNGFESGSGIGSGNTSGLEFTGIRSRSKSGGENGSEAVLNQNQIRGLSKNKQTAVSVKPIINISTPPGTQATTQTSGDGMNMDVMITMVEKAMSSNLRRGSGLSSTMEQMYGLNRASGAMR